MALALARSTTLLLRGERDHGEGLRKRPVMEDGAAMELLQPWREGKGKRAQEGTGARERH
eukprot:12410380-Ditylum_brightwellii.AAC.1